MRYVVTVGEHINHIFQNGELMLPKRIKNGNPKISSAVVLYSVLEDTTEK